MLNFYVSCRPIQIGQYLYDPREQLKTGFAGLDLSFDLIGADRSIDGRYLYLITLGENTEYTDQQLADYKAIVLEGLQAWSVHEKTLESAEALAELLTTREYAIVDDKIVDQTPKEERLF